MKHSTLFLLLGLCFAAISCMQDPVAPACEPNAPTAEYLPESLTRTSVILQGSLTGDVSRIKEYGFELSEDFLNDNAKRIFPNPPTDDGRHFRIAVDLDPGKHYVFRAYISNGSDGIKYSKEQFFATAPPSAPTLSDVSWGAGKLQAHILDDGGRPLKEAGFFWGDTDDIRSSKKNRILAVQEPGGLITATFYPPELGKTYYFIAYADNSDDPLQEAVGLSVHPVAITITEDFPAQIDDPEFLRQLTSQYDVNQDGFVSFKELRAIESLSVITDEIKSLNGIEMMPNLRSLSCCGSLPGRGQLDSLVIGHNPLLDTLACTNNRLSSIGLSGNTHLLYLDISGNPLHEIDISHCDSLQTFIALNCPSLKTILVRPGFDESTLQMLQKDSLAAFIVNEKMAVPISDAAFKQYLLSNFDTDYDGEISVEEALAITAIYVNTANITSLQGIEFFTNLRELQCDAYYNGRLTSLDVSHNPELTFLSCQCNQLKSLDVSHNTKLRTLSCNVNLLTQIDVSMNKSLVYFACPGNQIQSLDVRMLPELTRLICNDNRLAALDVSQNQVLLELHCGNNRLSALDVSHNTRLQTLTCFNNQLRTLDLTGNPYLSSLRCDRNPYLGTIILLSGQTIANFSYDANVSTIVYQE